MAARRCVDATGVGIEWDSISLGESAFLRGGHPLPAEAGRALLKAGRILKAPLESGHGVLSRNPNWTLNELFGVSASLRHVRAFEGAPTAHAGLDLVVIKQESWPETSRLESDSRDQSWENLRALGAPAHGAASVRFVSTERIRNFFEFALGYAARNGRRKVTVAHRIGTNPKTDGIWLEAAEKAARRFPSLEFEDMLTEHLALQLVRSPRRFDVILVPEHEGDTAGNIAVSLAGGLGFVPETLEGKRGRIHTTVHGTAPKYAALNRANPCAMILAAADMLECMGEAVAAGAVVAAVRETLAAGTRTEDAVPVDEPVGWTGTAEFTDEVAARIAVRMREAGKPGGNTAEKAGETRVS